MNDRLGDVPSWAVEEARAAPAPAASNESPPTGGGKKKKKGGGGGGGDVEMGNVQQQPQQAKHMEHFFREVESIKEDIESVKKATKTIGDINEAALQATTTEEENALSGQLRPLVDQTNKRAKRTKTLLGLLKEETKKLQDENSIKQSDLR